MIQNNIILYPEKYARLIISRRGLIPPIDIEALIKEYAELVYDDIPVPGIDGVSLNIKVPGKKPKVIVNNKIPRTRRRFTIAHELGHIIIPWHVGDLIIDLVQIDNNYYKDPWEHIEIERQANKFAAEILMPAPWVKDLFDSKQDLASIHKIITETCDVSPAAAALRMVDLHESAIAFSETNILNFSNSFGQSTKSKLVHIEKGQKVGKDQFDNISSQYSRSEFNYSQYYHWWDFSNENSIESYFTDNRTWQEILHQILIDLKVDDIVHMKQSINGIISAQHGDSKRNIENHTALNLFTSCQLRLARKNLEGLTSHPNYKEFLAKRVAAFFNR